MSDRNQLFSPCDPIKFATSPGANTVKILQMGRLVRRVASNNRLGRHPFSLPSVFDTRIRWGAHFYHVPARRRVVDCKQRREMERSGSRNRLNPDRIALSQNDTSKNRINSIEAGERLRKTTCAGPHRQPHSETFCTSLTNGMGMIVNHLRSRRTNAEGFKHGLRTILWRTKCPIRLPVPVLVLSLWHRHSCLCGLLAPHRQECLCHKRNSHYHPDRA
ncbi:hypothetical protein GobsT_60690 [Gemmata obscuriglobus]|nr:hypothetical protein GobsT_60690 [Gemmata obscuriglobus]VTS10586.1 unnamed protein product [Gemmata obscuriglobus UQM 2246]